MFAGLPVARGGGSALWTPADIGPYAWYDAELSPKTFGTGAQVAQWNDISGTGAHLSQATAGSRPTYSSVNQWVDFDGSNDQMSPGGATDPDGEHALYDICSD